MSCIDGKGSRTFCGKEECLYHYEKSFASFQGMCCGASDSKECEANGCNCGKKKVDCWDKEKNGDITPYMVSKGTNTKLYFTCNVCTHSWSPSLNKVSSSKDSRWCPPCGKKKQILSQTKTFLEFIEQASIKHDRKYKYDKTVYVNSKIPVIITCQRHGDWEQTPANHLWGFGCEQCGREHTADIQRLTKEEFIIKAVEKHGDKYGYDEVDYHNYKTKVNINCTLHGIFEQTPGNHLSGFGCEQCGIERRSNISRLTKDEFIEKSIQIHGSIYDYSKVLYYNNSTKVIIRCLIHGEFTQAPSNHLSGSGCSDCAGNKLLTIDKFIEKSIQIHGATYNYSNVIYCNSYTNVIIICSIHGKFDQTPANHLSGSGCIMCGHIKSGLKKRLTYDDFIIRATSIHENRYDYTHSIYIDYYTLIRIQCKEHDYFEQKPRDHLRGNGCQLCNHGGTRLSQDEFIRRSSIIHNNKYDYSNVVYETSLHTVIIICPIHGEFNQRPKHHLRGNGCKQCSLMESSELQRLSFDEFIYRSDMVHDHLYNYDQVVYINMTTPVIIICSIHGLFTQKPQYHIRGSGCQECCGTKQLTTEEFITRSNDYHDGKYDYSKCNYVNSSTEVTIICKTHGLFQQLPSVHMRGSGCRLCGINKRTISQRKTDSDFIEQARIIHGDKYGYEEMEYSNKHTDIEIICFIHGSFYQLPCVHLRGHGCKKCTNTSRSSKPAKEWILFIQSSCIEELYHDESPYGEYRIKNTRYFADGYNPLTKTIYEFHGSFWHGDPSIYQLDTINSVTGTTMGELYQKTQKKKQRCIELGYNYVEIWESKWYRFKKFIRMIQLRFRKRKSNPI